MLTRTHFEEVAKILGYHRVDDDIIESFIGYFRMENPRFDSYKFRQAVETARYRFGQKGLKFG